MCSTLPNKLFWPFFHYNKYSNKCHSSISIPIIIYCLNNSVTIKEYPKYISTVTVGCRPWHLCKNNEATETTTCINYRLYIFCIYYNTKTRNTGPRGKAAGLSSFKLTFARCVRIHEYWPHAYVPKNNGTPTTSCAIQGVYIYTHRVKLLSRRVEKSTFYP